MCANSFLDCSYSTQDVKGALNFSIEHLSSRHLLVIGVGKKSLIFLQNKKKKSDFYDLNQIFFIFPLDILDNFFFFNGLTSPQNIVIRGKNMYIIYCTALSVILGDRRFLEFMIKVSTKTSPRMS